jgi:integrase
MAALAAALSEHSDRRSADAVRLLILTGARRGETLSATWDQFDLAAGVWTKPSAATKQRKSHRIPLSPPARQHLVSIRERQDGSERFVFPGDKPGAPLTDVKKSWAALTAKATVLLWASQPETAEGKLVARLCDRKPDGALPTLAECRAAAKDLAAGLTDARLHDLRHSFASVLVSGGASLPLIGAMLGHTQVSTTARYAHLADDPLRAAAERVGAVWEAAQAAKLAEVVKLSRKR